MTDAGGLYVTARLNSDAQHAAARDRRARAKVEWLCGCRCTTAAGDRWADHDPTAQCAAAPDLPELLQMLGFVPTQRTKTTTTTRPRNDTGQGRWPAGARR